MREVGREMIILGAAAALPGIAAVKLATDFDASMTRIETLVGIARAEVDAMREDVLALAGETARAPKELAEALFVVTSAGARGANALSILEQSAKASAIGLGQTEIVARTVTAAITAYGTENLNAEQATNILVGTVREGNLEAASLAGSLGRVLGPAAALGVSFGDLGAFVATYTRLGGSAAEATTSLLSVMTTLIKPTTQSKEALDAVGLEMADLRRIAAEEGIAQAIFTITDAFEGNDEALASVIPNVRALRGVLAVAGNQAESFIAIQRSLNSELDLVNEGFTRVQETAQFKVAKALNDVRVELTSLGVELLPVATRLLSIVTSVTQAFAGLPGPLKVTGVAVGIVAGTVLVLGGLVTTLTGSLIALAPAALTAAGAVTKLGLAAGIAGGPLAIGLLVAGAIAASAAYIFFKRDTDKATEALRTQLDVLRDISDFTAEQAIEKLQQAERDFTDALAQRIRLERELAALQEPRAIEEATEEDRLVQRTVELRSRLEDVIETEKELRQIRADARADVELLTQALTLNLDDQQRLVAGTLEHIATLKEQRAGIVGVSEAFRLGIPLTEKQQQAYDDLTLQIATANDTLEGQELILAILKRQQDETAESTERLGDSAEDAAISMAKLSAEALAAKLILELLDQPLTGQFLTNLTTGLDAVGERVRLRIRQQEVLKKLVEDIVNTERIALGLKPLGFKEPKVVKPPEEEPRLDFAKVIADVRQRAIADLDLFGGLIQTALQRQAQAELDARRATIEATRLLLEDDFRRRIERIERERDAAVDAIEETTRARVDALNEQLRVLNRESRQEKRADIVRRLALAFDAKEQAKIEAELREFDRDIQRDAIRDEIRATEEQARTDIEIARDEADEQRRIAERALARRIDDLDAGTEAAQRAFAETTDAFALEAEARRLIEAENQEEIVRLLESFVPEWRTAGQTLGEQLVDGLRAGGIEDFLNETLKKFQVIFSLMGAGGVGPSLGVVPETAFKTLPGGGTVSLGELRAAGRALVAAGVPERVLNQLRQDIIETFGVLPGFQRGLEAGPMRQDGLAFLHRNELVVNPALGQTTGSTVNFERGAFEGMLTGANLAGSPRENARAIRREFEAAIDDQLGRGAFISGAGG